jgi:hypothetical protein
MLLKVAHIPAMCARMLATWPLVAVLGSRPDEAHCEATRATADERAGRRESERFITGTTRPKA